MLKKITNNILLDNNDTDINNKRILTLSSISNNSINNSNIKLNKSNISYIPDNLESIVSTSIQDSTLQRIFPQELDRNIFNEDIPLIMFCGLSNSGKTSIINVIYNNVPPHESLLFIPTQHGNITRTNSNSKLFTSIGIIDLPGQGSIQDMLINEDIFPKISSIVYVIDAQNEPYTNEISHAKKLFKRAIKANSNIKIEIFLHKVDTEIFAVDDFKLECQRDIYEKISTFISEDGFEIDIRFHFTSIYDYSVLEAISKVTQKIFPYSQILERLLDLLVVSCRFEKVLLMDIYSRTFLVSDSSLFDPLGFELCADILNVITEINDIYSGNNNLSSDISELSCSIQLNTGHILYIRSIDNNFVIACIIRNENFDKPYLVNLNVDIFRKILIMNLT
ncbi:putative GTP-binding protein Rag C [Cryptosporidium serpentis]